MFWLNILSSIFNYVHFSSMSQIGVPRRCISQSDVPIREMRQFMDRLCFNFPSTWLSKWTKQSRAICRWDERQSWQVLGTCVLFLSVPLFSRRSVCSSHLFVYSDLLSVLSRRYSERRCYDMQIYDQLCLPANNAVIPSLLEVKLEAQTRLLLRTDRSLLADFSLGPWKHLEMETHKDFVLSVDVLLSAWQM